MHEGYAPMERRNPLIQAYHSSIQHKILTPYEFVVDSSQITSSRLINIFETNSSVKKTLKIYLQAAYYLRASNVGRMRGTIICKNSL